MNRPLFGALGVAAVLFLSVGSCKNDPFSDLDTGTPAALVIDFSYLQMAIGTAEEVTASVVDGRATPLAIPVTFTPCTAAITVAVDTSYHPVPVTSARAIVTAVTANASCVRVAGGGFEDTIAVAVLPLAFDGTASPATPLVGQLFTLRGSTLLGFDVDSANIDFGGGVLGDIITRVGDTLTVRVPQPDATPSAPLTVLGVAVKYVPGLTVDLPTAASFTVTSAFGDRETPGVATITMPASGAADLVFWDGFRSGANGATTFIDYFYQFTLAATDTLTFTLDWAGGADLDMINLRSNFTVIGGFGAAGASHPETYTVVFTAGTYHLLVESFDDHADPARLFKVTIRNP